MLPSQSRTAEKIIGKVLVTLPRKANNKKMYGYQKSIIHESEAFPHFGCFLGGKKDVGGLYVPVNNTSFSSIM